FTSNGIYSSGYTDVYVPFNELVAYQMPTQGIFVYLTYNTTLSQDKVDRRSAKAISMLQEAFQVEFFEQVDSSSKAFTYYGVTPYWDLSMDIFTSQLPKDGYFKNLDVDRITSAYYLAGHHLSAGFASIDPYGGDLAGADLNSGISGILSQLNINATEVANFLGLNFTGEMSQVITQRTNLIFVQYEGTDDGINYVSSQQTYIFDLKAALGLAIDAQLEPSGSVWNSLMSLNPMGILSTMIDVNVISGNVTNWTFNCKNLTIDDEILDTIYLASSFIGSAGFNLGDILDALEFVIDNVFFTTHWEKTGALSKLYANIDLTENGTNTLLEQVGIDPSILDLIINITNFELVESPLALVGFRGLPYVPTGLLKPIPNVVVKYTVQKNALQPNLLVQEVVDQAIKPFQETVNLRLNVTNVGSSRAWGIKIGQGTANLTELLGGIFNAGVIDYEVRAFFIPSLFSMENFLSAYYGIENLLLDINSYRNGNFIVEGLLHTYDANGDGYLDSHELPTGIPGKLNPGDPYNYIDTGDSLLIDISDSSLTGLYTPFTNESSNFTTSVIKNGTQVPPVTTNNNTNAQVFDGTTWDITSQFTGGTNNVTVEFTFSNKTSNVVKNKIAAIDFSYQCHNNVSIWENGVATFYIFNYNTAKWVPVNNLTRSTISINSTSSLNSSTFRIYDGRNDTLNQTINITHYMSGPNNTVRVQLRINNNVSTLLSIDNFDMNYLQRNTTLIQVPRQSFAYTDTRGYTVRETGSNSLYVGSQNASSLLVNQWLSSTYISTPGFVQNLTIDVTNRGNKTAVGVEISIPVPGIIRDAGDFVLNGNYMNLTIPSIAAGASISGRFEFFIPNSEIVPGITVRYDNQTSIIAGEPDFTIRGNDIYIDAPVDYKTASSRPYVIEMSISMGLVNTSFVPDLNNLFSVQYAINATHSATIPGPLTIALESTPYFTMSGGSSLSIAVNSTAQKSFNKTSYKGYLVPSFDLDGNDMATLMRYVQPTTVQVGIMQLSIQKTVGTSTGDDIDQVVILPEVFHITRDDFIVVIVVIQNTGTLPIGFMEMLDSSLRNGFYVGDNLGYAQDGFAVIFGLLSAANITLEPGEAIMFGYGLQAKRVGIYVLGSVEKEFYFLRRQTVTSNSFTVTIDEKPALIATYVGVSGGLTLVIVLGSLYNKKKQERALAEFKKRDRILYDELTTTNKSYDQYLE
nr:hypothetical protein [Candidatus Sigynarchaeota archaeon]